MFQITKTPILILSSPRTGSTVFGEYILRQCSDKSLRYFIEPDYTAEDLEKFTQEFVNSKNFILKTHLVYLDKYSSDIREYLITNAYKIRILRRNFVKQVASFYIAYERQSRWIYKHSDKLDFQDVINIDVDVLLSRMLFIKRTNDFLINAQIDFDCTVYYEDLPQLDNVRYRITPPPANYHEILAATENLASRLEII